MVELGQLMKLIDSKSELAWRNSLFDLAHHLGFDYVLYAVMPSKHAKLETSFLQTNYSPVWREQYDPTNMHYVDPTVNHCMSSVLPLVWESEAFLNKDKGQHEY